MAGLKGKINAIAVRVPVANGSLSDIVTHLKKALEAAEPSGAIVFFDEADSLLRKRTEVRDSHGRLRGENRPIVGVRVSPARPRLQAT
jgi:glyceraldehyde-3-phosphate dehydrogenase/erythrose-4-phosphate dehydrogenase